MTKKEIKFYNEGAEFIDDVISEYDPDLDLDEEEFGDFIYYKVTLVGKITIDDKVYCLYELQDGSLYAVISQKSLYEYYLRWVRLTA